MIKDDESQDKKVKISLNAAKIVANVVNELFEELFLDLLKKEDIEDGMYSYFRLKNFEYKLSLYALS